MRVCYIYPSTLTPHTYDTHCGPVAIPPEKWYKQHVLVWVFHVHVDGRLQLSNHCTGLLTGRTAVYCLSSILQFLEGDYSVV